MLLFNIALLFLCLICGLRDPFIYPDIENYYDWFYGDMSNMEEGSVNIGFLLLNKIVYLIAPSFFAFCFVVSAIVVSGYGRIIKLYSPYIWMSLLIYVLINYYPSFFLLKQYMAMAMFFVSIKYIISRERTKFFVFALLAFSMHTTAIAIFPLYFLYGIPCTKKNMFILLLGVGVLTAFLMEIGVLLGAYNAYYAQYLDMSSEGPAWQRAVMKVYIALVYFYALKRNVYNEGINRIIFYSMLFNVVICVGAMNIFGAFRLREYYSIADIIGLPLIVFYAKTSDGYKKYLVLCMTFIYAILLFISFVSFVTGGNMGDGYHFFWESN